MYQVGASDTEIKAKLRLTDGTWANLYNDPEFPFREVVDFGRILAKAWWLTIGRENVSKPAKDFNANLWLMNMKNRWNWSDKTTVKSTKDVEDMDSEELDAKVREAVKKVQSKFR